MEFTQVVENRYSCKNFSGRKVEAEKLQVILEAGRVAPTAKKFTGAAGLCRPVRRGAEKDRRCNALPLWRSHLPGGGL